MKSKSKQSAAILFAILAATLYAISSPLSKIVLVKIPATMMAALLYLGAGIGMSIIAIFNRIIGKPQNEKHLTKNELPFTIAMILLDIAAPIFLMMGLARTTAANTSLLNNFEIASTAIIALCFFKEKITKRLWISIILVTVASMILSVEDISSFSFSIGSLYVLLACICWGLENNCTRMLSSKNPLEIVIIKGFGSGCGSLIIAFIMNQKTDNIIYILVTLLLGFISYGLSIFFYVHAQRYLGAAKTSTYYAIAPFIGVAFSLVIFKDIPSVTFIIALLIMVAGTYLASVDTIAQTK